MIGIIRILISSFVAQSFMTDILGSLFWVKSLCADDKDDFTDESSDEVENKPQPQSPQSQEQGNRRLRRYEAKMARKNANKK